MAVIKKRELQEDGHYQVSLYDEKKQELVHRWSENKNGKKDGEEIEYFKGSQVIKKRINWKDGKREGTVQEYDLAKRLLSETEYQDGNPISTKSYIYDEDIRKMPRSFLNFLKNKTSLGLKISPDKIMVNHYELISGTTRHKETKTMHGYDLDGEFAYNTSMEVITNAATKVSMVVENGTPKHVKLQINRTRTLDKTYDGVFYDMIFKDGQEYDGICCFDNVLKYCYKKGIPDGEIRTDTFDGKFKNGKFTGKKYTTRHRNALLNDQWQTLEDGNLISTNIGYDIQITQDGTVFVDKYNEHIKYQTKNGKKNGIYTEFFDKLDGKMKVSGFYKEGKKEGFWKYYAKDGTVIKQEYYHEGKNCTKKYEILKKVASERIKTENELSEGKNERVVLPKMKVEEKQNAIKEAKKDLSR